MPSPRASRSSVRALRPAALLLAAVVVLCAAAAPAHADLTDITVTPTSGATGVQVSVSGGSCKKSGADASTVRVHGPSLGIDQTVTANPNGSWSTTFAVPPGASAGSHVLAATCQRGTTPEPYVPVTFTVIGTAAPPTSTIAPPTTAPSPTTAPTSPPTSAIAPAGSNPGTVGPPASAGPVASGGPAASAPSGPSSEPSSSVPGSTATKPTDVAAGTEAPATAPAPSAVAPTEHGDDGTATSSSTGDGAAAWVVLAAFAVAAPVAGWYARRHARRGQLRPAPGAPVPAAALPVAALPVGEVPVAALPAAPAPVARPEPTIDVLVAADLSAVDVSRAVAAMEPQIRAVAGPRVAVHLDVDPRPCPVRLGPRHLDAVILPLVDNASRALPDGGTIRVAVGRGPSGTSPERADDPDRALVVVADTGPGIPADVIADLRVSLAHTGGATSASGLPAVHAIVSRLGGHVDITSVAGHGTSVTVALPLDESSEPPSPAPLELPDADDIADEIDDDIVHEIVREPDAVH
jgi:hypothetical protein